MQEISHTKNIIFNKVKYLIYFLNRNKQLRKSNVKRTEQIILKELKKFKHNNNKKI